MSELATDRAGGLSARNLDVVYESARGATHALAGINCVIEPGEFVTIIGPSGCGKSTLLHCLGGMLKPTSGEVHWDSVPVTGPDPSKAAFVFQDYSLYPWLSVLENASIGLRFARRRRAQRHEVGNRFLNLVGLAHAAGRYPHELSGGMQQRVAVARALSMDPRTLLMDEPFGALDEQTRRQLGYEMVQLLTAQGKTVVTVTHSLDEAIFWADRILVMAAGPGRIRAELKVGTPRPRNLDFIATPHFAELRMKLFELISLQPPTESEAVAEVAQPVDAADASVTHNGR
jgi:NitT/TauT family transport system ATP-binding protein